MIDTETTYRNGLYIRSAQGVTEGFVAWAKQSMFTGSDPLDEPGEVWFEFGATRDDAVDKVASSITTKAEDAP